VLSLLAAARLAGVASHKVVPMSCLTKSCRPGIDSLTDEDMQRIADKLSSDYFIGFEEGMRFLVAC